MHQHDQQPHPTTAQVIDFQAYLEAYEYAKRVMVEEFGATDEEEIQGVAREFAEMQLQLK